MKCLSSLSPLMLRIKAFFECNAEVFNWPRFRVSVSLKWIVCNVFSTVLMKRTSLIKIQLVPGKHLHPLGKGLFS